MRTLSLFITCKPSSKPCILKLGRPGLEFHSAAVLWHMRTDQLFMNLSFLISTFTWFLPHLTSWTGRWGHINNNDTYFLGNHPLQLTEDVGSPVKFTSLTNVQVCAQWLPLTPWRALLLLHTAPGLRSVLLLPELRTGPTAASPVKTDR